MELTYLSDCHTSSEWHGSNFMSPRWFKRMLLQKTCFSGISMTLTLTFDLCTWIREGHCCQYAYQVWKDSIQYWRCYGLLKFRKFDVYDVIVTSVYVAAPKMRYHWNQGLKTFPTIYYSICCADLRTWPWLRPQANFSRSRSKVKVKVTEDRTRIYLQYALDLKSLRRLELELWALMCFRRFAWPWPCYLTLSLPNN